MRSLQLLPAIVLLLASIGCNHPKPATNGNNDTVTDGNDAILQEMPFLVFERTACLGTCPQFVMSVDSDGSITYEGKRFAEPEGSFTGQFQEGVPMNIFNEAKRIGFFNLEDKYDAEVTDLPSMVIHIRTNGEDKKIMARYNVPKELKEFGKYLDTLMKSVDWKPAP